MPTLEMCVRNGAGKPKNDLRKHGDQEHKPRAIEKKRPSKWL